MNKYKITMQSGRVLVDVLDEEYTLFDYVSMIGETEIYFVNDTIAIQRKYIESIEAVND